METITNPSITNALVKHLVVEVEGEAVIRFFIASMPDGDRFEMIEAILASTPTMRLVDHVEIGQIWNGTEYVAPS